MRWIICATLVLLLAPIQAATTGTVNGSVVNSDGKAMVGQKVRFKRVLSRPPIGKVALAADSLAVATVTTDKEGKFTQDLEPGEYWAEAGNKANGYAKERFTIKTGEKTEIKLTLTKEESQK